MKFHEKDRYHLNRPTSPGHSGSVVSTSEVVSFYPFLRIKHSLVDPNCHLRWYIECVSK